MKFNRRRIASPPGTTSKLPPQPFIPDYIASCFVPPRAAMPDDKAKAQMASDMREAAQREGGITRDELKLLGWTGAQLDRLGDAARIKAQSLSGVC